MASILNEYTVDLDDAQKAVVIINQEKLPCEEEKLYLKTQKEIWAAIKRLQVRGAPAIGVTAAMGIYLAVEEITTEDKTEFFRQLHEAKEYLASSRPTAVNLFWALDRMERTAQENQEKSIGEIKERLHKEALEIRDEDIRVCKAIGEYGSELLQDGMGILTHCNAGKLAAVQYGTALAPIYRGQKKGYTLKVFADETRPLLQGARLTATELHAHGIETTLICDNMASQVMKNGWVQAVFVGCDRVAANGDVCNKIGTSGVAILAKHYGIPFYVCAPTATIDLETASGADVPIEQRNPEEVTEMWYEQRMAPEGVKVFNPAFDCTDHELVTGIITEFGIARAPYTESLKEIFDKKEKMRKCVE